MRALLLALPLLIAAAPQPATTDVLAPDAESHWVAFDLTAANQIRFATTVRWSTRQRYSRHRVSTSVLSRAFIDRN